MQRDSAIKKLLKIFLFIFSIYIFTIKIFLKNTYYVLIHKKRKKKESFGFSGHIQGQFRPFPACFGRFPACFGRIGRQPIRPDFGRISPVQRKSKPIQHESSRISANRAESARIQEKKKKNTDADRRAGNRVGRGCGTSGAVSVLPSCSDQYLSPNEDFSDLDLLQFFRLQGSDKHGNHIFCVVGKYFPGKQT